MLPENGRLIDWLVCHFVNWLNDWLVDWLDFLFVSCSPLLGHFYLEDCARRKKMKSHCMRQIYRHSKFCFATSIRGKSMCQNWRFVHLLFFPSESAALITGPWKRRCIVLCLCGIILFLFLLRWMFSSGCWAWQINTDSPSWRSVNFSLGSLCCDHSRRTSFTRCVCVL